MTTPNGTQPATEPAVTPARVTLPSGGWVTFANPEDLTGNDHRRVVKNMRAAVTIPAGATTVADLTKALGESGQITGLAMDYNYGMACMLIAAWDIPYAPKGSTYLAHQVPVPADDPDVLGMLRYRDYRTILDAAAPLVAATEVGAGEVTPDDADVPGSPTVPAGG